MKEGKLKELARALKEQYDKYDRKMFFIMFYSACSTTSISEISDYDGFINNMPIDMIHIHMCDSGNYIDVYEWELEDFEITDVYVKIKHKNKEDIVYFYETKKKLPLNSNFYAIQLDDDGNLFEHKYITPYVYFGNYALKNENGDYFEHYFKMEYLNKVVDFPNHGSFLFFTKEEYRKHMEERLLKIVLNHKREIVKRESSLIETICKKLERSN